MVIWIIGLAGSGKTTVAREVVRRRKVRNPATVLLDGDIVREIMGGDLGHTLSDRERNGWRVCRLGRELERQGIDVVCAILSLFPEQRAWNRQSLQGYREVYLDVPMSVLEARDQKGLYSGARTGTVRDVAGIDLPFEPPSAPDLVIDNGIPREDFGDVAERVLAAAFPDA